MSDARSLYLVGFMGAGKTAVGRELAQRLGRDLVDTDAIVERDAGRSVESIVEKSGEVAFRDLERRALMGIVSREGLIVATGGGLFAGAGNRRAIRESGRSLWLDVDLEIARERIGEGGGRPLWTTSDPVRLRAFFERRRAAYALADIRVDASDPDPARVAERVLERFSSIFR